MRSARSASARCWVGVALLVGVEVKSLLIGQGVEPKVLERMRAHLSAEAEVEQIYSLLTQQMGSGVMVAVKAKLRDGGSASSLIETINRVERSFRAAFPQVRWLFFEPDSSD